MTTVSTTRTGAIAVITLNHPPVNAMSFELRRELLAALDAAQDDPAVAAVVLHGANGNFSGGADVHQFGTPLGLAAPLNTDIIRAIDEAPKPVVAAIAGHCLGGGLELALGCHVRVAHEHAQLGQPEVKLGILPGAGGTQRLPRAVGLPLALEMIVSGTPRSGKQLADSGLLDAVTGGDVLATAIAFANDLVASGKPLRRLRDVAVVADDAAAQLAAARAAAKKSSKFLIAPQRCIDAVAMAVELPIDEAITREREMFLQLLAGPESRAMRHVFAAERNAARIDDLPAGTSARHIASVGIIGAGTMGGGIAMAFANAGLPVLLLETTQEALDRGLANIRRNYQNSVTRGSLGQADMDSRLARIKPTLNADDFAGVDLMIEAVFENLDVKAGVFKKMEVICKPGAILATNTSYLNVDTIAACTQRPEDVIGLHFFSPANVMKLLEVVRGAKTAPDVLQTAMSLAKRIKKVPVVSGVCDGFIGNRMLARYTAAANDLLNIGALPQEVDAALEGFGMAMGVFRMGDLAGLDIGWATRKRRAAENPGIDFSIVADRLCEAGRFGQKTGSGWYRYEAGQRDALPEAQTEQAILAWRAERGIVARPVSAQEIVERCIYALVNEGARILAEGIAQRASDIDVVYLNGYGFPRHRGGPMKFAEEMGLANVVRSLRRFAKQSPQEKSWQPAPLLVQLAWEGKGFN